jgi:F-type H+-transporting ATPase subunit epsilon
MAKASSLELVVITPEKQVLAATVDSVIIPAHDGELGILRDRAPLMCELGIGQLRFTQGGQTRRLYIDGGFAQVLSNKVTVLTSNALSARQIKPETIAAVERTATAATPEPGQSSFDVRRIAAHRVSALRAVQSANVPVPDVDAA